MRKFKVKSLILNKIIPMLIIITGIFITAYPWISNYMYKDRVSNVMTEYDNVVENTSDDELKKMREEARKYNKNLRKEVSVLRDPFDENQIEPIFKEYADLPFKGSNVMGYIEIPKIGVKLPIYYGVTPAILEAGVGHLEGTSFPIGDKSTHSVLTGHTGLSNKKMFTDLVEMDIGDTFFLRVLNETLCYKVNEINVVLPEDNDKLCIQEGRELCTLITCTPYGINDHRLLVMGERTEYVEGMEEKQLDNDYISDWQMEYIRCILMGIVIVLLLILVAKVIKKCRKKDKLQNGKEKAD